MAGEASADVATRFVDEIEAAIQRLRQFPLGGVAREQLGAGLRVIFHHPYAVYYVPSLYEVVVVRVLHGARDAAAIAERGGFQ